MVQKITKLIFLFAATFTILSCSNSDDDYTKIIDDDNPDVDIPIDNHLEIDFTNVPFTNLSDYNFFVSELKNHEPNTGVLPFDLNSHLFTDYASKKRFVWMPEGSKATYINDHEILDFPEKTILIKSFYYDNVQPSNSLEILETRLMIKINGEWIFATYQWNEEQTDAILITEGATKNITFTRENQQSYDITYKIPSNFECFVCHKNSEVARPIGPKPQNLNKNYNYADGIKNQLQKWIDVGYLQNNLPASIVSTVNWEDTTLDTELRVRSYVDINCAHCHIPGGHCAYRELRFDFNVTTDVSLMGTCMEQGDHFSSAYPYIISPGKSSKSALLARISTNEENIMMPMIGRTIVHQEAISLIEHYIDNLTTNCD